MGLKDLGKLAKLKIIANGDEFEVMFNPESYSEKFSTLYRKRETANSAIEEFDYIKSIPQDFKLKIIIDGTGVSDYHTPFLPAFKKLDESVYKKVNKFLQLTWLPHDGKPNALEIKWGEFSFHCRLKDVNIKYTLFNREGLPLRAEMDATFIGCSEKNKDYYKKRFQSVLVSSPTTSGSGSNRTASNNSKQGTNGIKITVS
ncbi:MAG: hypothetical protein ACMUJM_17050 [bacterium]